MFTRQITISWFLNYLNMGLGFVFTLFLTPFIIRGLGQHEFGIYSLIGSFAAYLNLLEFGMGAAVVRYVAKYNAEKDEKGKENFLAMILTIHVGVAILILITGLLLTTQLDTIFAASLTDMADVRKSIIMLSILSVSLAFCSITNIFVGVLAGYEQFIFPRVISTISWIGRILATIVILMQIPTAVAITALTAGVAMIAGSINTYYAIHKYNIRIKFYAWKMSLLKEVLSFSFYNFLLQIMGLLYWNIGIMIVGMQMPAAKVAVYSIGIQLNLFALMFSNSINSLFLPHATKMMVSAATEGETTIFVAKIGRIILMLYGGIFLGFVFFGKLFINLWAGKGFEGAYYVTLIALAAAAIPRIQGGINNVLKAKNMQKIPAIAYVCAAALSVPISWMLSKQYGLNGVILGASIGLIAGNVIIANIYYEKFVGIDLMLFFKKTFSGALPVVLISCLAGYALSHISGATIKTLSTQCMIFITIYSVALYYFGMTPEERGTMRDLTKKIRHRL